MISGDTTRKTVDEYQWLVEQVNGLEAEFKA